MHLILRNNLIPALNAGIINSFSGGQDSSFLFFCLLHQIQQREVFLIHSYQNHMNQTLNFFTEIHNWKLLRNCSSAFISNIFCTGNCTEITFSDFRSDCLIRQIVFFKYSYLFISHSQTDFFESLLVNFFHKSVLDGNSVKQDRLLINKTIYYWPRLLENRILRQSLLKKTRNWQIYSKKKITRKDLFVIRPLVSLSRFSIQKILIEQKFPKQNDYTNFNRTYLHNYCRHELIPLLKLKVGRDFTKNLFFNYSKPELSKNQLQDILNQTYSLTKNFICIEVSKPEKRTQILKLIGNLYSFCLFKDEQLLFGDVKVKDSLVIQIVQYPQVLINKNFLMIRFN